MHRSLIAAIAGFLLVLCALEVALRVLPVPNGITAADARKAWPIRTMTPHQRYTHSTGWYLGNVRRGETNDYGYVSPFDYQGLKGGVAVLGDSFVESLMNDYDQAITGALGKWVDSQLPVMNFGISGSSMAHYFGSAPLIAERFKPEWGVVVLGVGDFYAGFNAGPGQFRWDPDQSPPVELVPERTATPMVKFIRSLALVRYLRGSLKFNMRTLFNTRPTAPNERPACTEARLEQKDRNLLHAFVDGFAPALSLPPSRVVLVFDADRKAIYQRTRPARTCPSRDALVNQELIALARARGYHVVEMRPIFTEHYVRTRQQVDYLPEDGHWNAVGHGLAAREVAKIIEQQSEHDQSITADSG